MMLKTIKTVVLLGLITPMVMLPSASKPAGLRKQSKTDYTDAPLYGFMLGGLFGGLFGIVGNANQSWDKEARTFLGISALGGSILGLAAGCAVSLFKRQQLLDKESLRRKKNRFRPINTRPDKHDRRASSASSESD